MKHFLVIGSLVWTGTFGAAFAQTTNAPTASAPHPAFKPLVFHPSSEDSGGILPVRVGGGSRGDKADNMVNIAVLVPDQLALTVQAQPSLYWYQDKATKTVCEITVTEPKDPKPLVMLKTGQSTPAGIHAIRLSKFNVKLEPNVVYKWSVAVVLDPENRSQDIIANGVIKRIEPSPDLAAKLAAASDQDKAAIYAEGSIWYDALQAISDQIAKDPQDSALRDERADLLKQVGLPGAQMESTVAKSP
jgi:hypothetical protein